MRWVEDESLVEGGSIHVGRRAYQSSFGFEGKTKTRHSKGITYAVRCNWDDLCLLASVPVSSSEQTDRSLGWHLPRKAVGDIGVLVHTREPDQDQNKGVGFRHQNPA